MSAALAASESFWRDMTAPDCDDCQILTEQLRSYETALRQHKDALKWAAVDRGRQRTRADRLRWALMASMASTAVALGLLVWRAMK